MLSLQDKLRFVELYKKYGLYLVTKQIKKKINKMCKRKLLYPLLLFYKVYNIGQSYGWKINVSEYRKGNKK